MNRNMFFCLVLVACSSRAVTLEDLPFETVVETAGESTPKLVSYGKAAEMVANDAAFPVATNALALAEGALQSSWAETGTVSRATMADMLHSSGGDMWLEIDGGKTYIVEVTNSTSVYVVSTSGEGYNGPPAGTVWINPVDVEGQGLAWEPIQDGLFVAQKQPIPLYYALELYDNTQFGRLWRGPTREYFVFPDTLDTENEYAVGSLIIDWVPITNRFEVAKQEPTVLLISGSISGHNSDTNTTAHAGMFAAAATWQGATNIAAGAVAAVQAEVAGKQTAETVVSGAVGTASAGNRYFWTTATNVVLSVNLTGGQVVNYAALRNTATNAITATASTSGWKWTGGSMTNTIPAGKMMTFGWAVDPSTGATNAYATAASEN